MTLVPRQMCFWHNIFYLLKHNFNGKRLLSACDVDLSNLYNKSLTIEANLHHIRLTLLYSQLSMFTSLDGELFCTFKAWFTKFNTPLFNNGYPFKTKVISRGWLFKKVSSHVPCHQARKTGFGCDTRVGISNVTRYHFGSYWIGRRRVTLVTGSQDS